MQDIQVHKLGCFPIVKHYLEELGVYELFTEHLKDSQSIHAESLCVLITNIIISVRPLYKISDWLKDYTDGQSEFGYEAKRYTDDRLGESLDILYKSDRASLMSAASSKAIQHFELATDKIHNDTTTVSFSGAYEGEPKQGTVQLKRGYNKDGRPDAKQIVFGLNVTSDGNVPILANCYDGNINDSDTHQVNWSALKELLQKTDFIYIADSKVATIENMAHIAKYNGLFISILPATRSEVQKFKNQVSSGLLCPDWQTILTKPHSRDKNKEVVYKTCASEQTKEGYALHWIHSSSKEVQDAKKRQERIATIHQALEITNDKLNSYYLKTPEQIQKAIDKILSKEAALFEVQIKEHTITQQVKIGRGRIGKNSQFKEETKTTYFLEWSEKQQAIEAQARLDGIFPLVSNTELDAAQVLSNYKNQPYLEKRFYTLKSILEVAPVFLKLPHRIEAMLFLYFIALMVIALIERAIRKNMTLTQTQQLPILPQKMNTKKPTWNNIRYFFEQVFFMAQKGADNSYSFLTKGFSKMHQKILDLIKVPSDSFNINTLNWWNFNPI